MLAGTAGGWLHAWDVRKARSRCSVRLWEGEAVASIAVLGGGGGEAAEPWTAMVASATVACLLLDLRQLLGGEP